MLVTCVAGARPNFMKIKPVVDALEAVGIEVDLLHTGQHYDQAMSDVFFDDLGLRSPDVHLGAGSGSHGEQTARVMVLFEQYMNERRPDGVVVVGDVNSTLACSIVAAKAGAVVAHVEAGLRSRDWAMPEEVNRVVADRLADLLFAPSPDGVENLRAEGYREDQIHLVGNVMIDTLLKNVERAKQRSTLSDLGLTAGGYAAVTLHRPSNVDDDASLARLVGAISEVSSKLPVVFPAHPRTAGKLSSLDLPPSFRVIEPLGYLDFLALQASARLVLTDSGGIQEETTALGVPCLTLRENTERPITITEGTNTLVGTDPAAIIAAAGRALAGKVEPRCPELWDGHAGDRIAAVLKTRLKDPSAPRPTDLA
ncbi:MAG: UDP-N-acetylglucosamine 2-epimerase (non-hydrolyzing) [Acidimicrobiales bacterium]